MKTDSWLNLPFSMKSVTAIALLTGSLSFAQSELIIYPNDDQDAEQQELDEFECYRFGKKESGFDPMAPPTVSEPPPQQEASKGGLGRGALRGAVVGGIVDGSDGAKTGAAAGAAVGGMRRADQNRRQAQSQQQYEQEQAQQYQQQRNLYNRAFAACMEGRGYTVR
jgi:hypothetical protein